MSLFVNGIVSRINLLWVVRIIGVVALHVLVAKSIFAQPVTLSNLSEQVNEASLQTRLDAIVKLEEHLSEMLQDDLQRQIVIESRYNLNSAMTGAPLAMQSLMQIRQSVVEFQDVYDSYSYQMVTYLIDYSAFGVQQLLSQIDSSLLTKSDKRKLLDLVKQIDNTLKENMDARNPEKPWADPKARFNSTGSKYFKTLEHMDLLLTHILKVQQTQPRRSNIPAISQLRKLRAQLQAIPVLWNIVFAQKPQNEEVGRLALPMSMKKATARAAEILGYNFEIDNIDRLDEALSDRGTITLIVPNHTHAYGDLLLSFHIAADDTVPVSAINAVTNIEYVLKKAIENGQVIAVGSSHLKPTPPMEKAVEILRRGTSNSVLIFPQGNLTAGALEVRPPAEKFPLLVKHLIDSGFKVQLLPVVYKNSGSPLVSDWRMLAPDDRVLKADILEPIKHDEVKYLLGLDEVKIGETPIDSTKGESLRRVLRQHWLSNMATDSKYLAGMMRIEEALHQLSFVAPTVAGSVCEVKGFQ